LAQQVAALSTEPMRSPLSYSTAIEKKNTYYLNSNAEMFSENRCFTCGFDSIYG
jgi:hypothetical protein